MGLDGVTYDRLQSLVYTTYKVMTGLTVYPQRPDRRPDRLPNWVVMRAEIALTDDGQNVVCNFVAWT